MAAIGFVRADGQEQAVPAISRPWVAFAL